jgi:tripartite-type tricarboxylate transporter receptor subunit TctC
MRAIIGCGMLVAILFSSVAVAQGTYPNRPVKFIAGFGPGSAVDVAGRLVVPRLSELLGQPILVENRAGAGSAIAAENVARAPADGYTLFLGSVANAISASLTKNPTFDFLKDLAPLSGLVTLPHILVVHPSVQARTVQEFIALSKSGSLMYGSSGNGTSAHLSAELFNLMTGAKLVHVPYKGSPQVMTDLLAGRVALMFSPASTVLPHIKAGTLRALATTGRARAAAAPDLPTIIESGLPGYETNVWFGLFGPAGLPTDIVERLSTAMNQAIQGAELKTQFAVQGMDPLPLPHAAFAGYVRHETEKWARVVKETGMKAD